MKKTQKFIYFFNSFVFKQNQVLQVYEIPMSVRYQDISVIHLYFHRKHQTLRISTKFLNITERSGEKHCLAST